MPFRSKRQARFLFANKPKLAKKWAKKYGGYKNKPERAKCPKGAAGKACRARRRK
jgi:hypothetical protein